MWSTILQDVKSLMILALEWSAVIYQLSHAAPVISLHCSYARVLLISDWRESALPVMSTWQRNGEKEAKKKRREGGQTQKQRKMED